MHVYVWFIKYKIWINQTHLVVSQKASKHTWWKDSHALWLHVAVFQVLLWRKRADWLQRSRTSSPSAHQVDAWLCWICVPPSCSEAGGGTTGQRPQRFYKTSEQMIKVKFPLFSFPAELWNCTPLALSWQKLLFLLFARCISALCHVSFSSSQTRFELEAICPQLMKSHQLWWIFG